VEVLVGEPAFHELKLCHSSAFERCEVQLKGYETLSTAWSTSFEGLRQFIAGVGR
jgi:hypothetical protein